MAVEEVEVGSPMIRVPPELNTRMKQAALQASAERRYMVHIYQIVTEAFDLWLQAHPEVAEKM